MIQPPLTSNDERDTFRPYHIVGKEETQELAKFLAKNGQALLPMVELIEQSKLAVDELIDVLGRAQIEAVLRLSGQGIAGPAHPGKKGGAIGWHGGEEGRVCLKERRLRVRRPRLRKKGQGEEGEVPIPAYETMRQDGKLGSRMLEILLRGVSTRQYGAVLPEMAETVGVSRSSVSREAIEASEEELKRLCERRFDAVEPAGHLSGWGHLWRPSRAGGGGRGRGRKEARPGISRGRQ